MSSVELPTCASLLSLMPRRKSSFRSLKCSESSWSQRRSRDKRIALFSYSMNGVRCLMASLIWMGQGFCAVLEAVCADLGRTAGLLPQVVTVFGASTASSSAELPSLPRMLAEGSSKEVMSPCCFGDCDLAGHLGAR